MGCTHCWSFVEGRPGQPPGRKRRPTGQGRTPDSELTSYLPFPGQCPSPPSAILGVQIRALSGPCVYAPRPGGDGAIPGGPGLGEGVTCFIKPDRPSQALNHAPEGLKSSACVHPETLGFGSKACSPGGSCRDLPILLGLPSPHSACAHGSVSPSSEAPGSPSMGSPLGPPGRSWQGRCPPQ